MSTPSNIPHLALNCNTTRRFNGCSGQMSLWSPYRTKESNVYSICSQYVYVIID